MHVSGRKLAVSGLLAAFSVVLIILATVMESSSLFFIAAASFCVGIALREWGVYYGTAFYVATTLLGFLVAPNKMYCLTFAGMGFWLVGSELIWRWLATKKTVRQRTMFLWIGKYIIFNLMYVPVLIFLPHLLMERKMSASLFILLLLGGQLALWVYDRAHIYIQIYVWGKFRGKLLGNI